MMQGRIGEVKPHSKGCALTLNIGGQEFQADFSYESGERLDRNCQELAGILAANFALSYLPLDDIEFVCSDDEEFRLMSTLAYQNRMSYAYFIKDTDKRASDHLLTAEPHYTYRNADVDKVNARVNANSVLCFYSGGKDSTVSLNLLEAAGYSALPLVAYLKNDAYRHTADDAPKYLRSIEHDFAVANTNIDELKAFFSEVTGMPRLEGTIRLYWVANALPLATGINARFISLSGELTLTHVVHYAGRRIFNNLFDQAFPAAVLVNRLLDKKGLPSIFSAVQGLTVLGVQKILATRYSDELAHQLTCNEPVYDDKAGQWRCCCECRVCHSLYLVVKGLGMQPAAVRLDEDKILSGRLSPDTWIGPAISREEVEHCLAIDNTYAPDYPAKQHPEVGGIRFSPAYHNPALGLTADEYRRFYSLQDQLLQGGIYLSENGESRESNLEEVWQTLSRYDYVFDGKDAHVVKKV